MFIAYCHCSDSEVTYIVGVFKEIFNALDACDGDSAIKLQWENRSMSLESVNCIEKQYSIEKVEVSDCGKL